MMNQYKQKNNINTKQRAHLCSSKLTQGLKEVLSPVLRWGNSLPVHISPSRNQQLFHRGWDLLFDFEESQERIGKAYRLPAMRDLGLSMIKGWRQKVLGTRVRKVFFCMGLKPL